MLVSSGMLGKVILPPLTSGEGDSTCRMIVSSGGAGVTVCCGRGGSGVAAFEDAIASALWDEVSRE
jgi:hypothetical protein